MPGSSSSVGRTAGGTPGGRRALYWWLWLERVGFRGLVLPARRLAAAAAAVDDRAVDAGVRETARVGRALAGWSRERDERVFDRVVEAASAGTVTGGFASRRVDERGVDELVEGSARGVGLLGRLARRPQTGFLHQYYTQAGVVLFVLVVWLLVVLLI
jgi:NADH-quinone oxidoreductase subunit L